MDQREQQFSKPTSGRIVMRATGEGTLYLGVLHFPSNFAPQEGAAYLLVVETQTISVATRPLDDGLEPQYRSSPLAMLTCSPVWFRTTTPSACTIRFTRAFETGNGWSFVGVSCHSQMPLGLADADHHAWYDLTDGQCLRIGAPASAAGQAWSSLLRDSPIWPDQTGQLYSVPALPSPFREPMHRLHKLLAAFGRSELTKVECEVAIAADDKLQEIAGFKPFDIDYARFLAALDAEGQLAPEQCMSQSCFHRRERVTHRIARQLYS